jgi:hypothetical protein
LSGKAVAVHSHALALAHAGRGGKCKKRGIAHLERRGRRLEAGLHKRQRGRLGRLLARARDGVPQQDLVSLPGAERMDCISGLALRAGTGPQRRVTEDRPGRSQGGNPSLLGNWGDLGFHLLAPVTKLGSLH